MSAEAGRILSQKIQRQKPKETKFGEEKVRQQKCPWGMGFPQVDPVSTGISFSDDLTLLLGLDLLEDS